MLIEVYTDGSATVASKPGGFGYVLVIDGVKHSEGNGHMQRATNNDAEMEAAIQGMAAVVRLLMSMPNVPNEVHLRSDSQIVLNWANGNSAFKQSAKIQKYDQLRSLYTRLKAQTKWVKGHSGHEHNERCDVLANLGRHKLTPQDEIKKPTKRIKKIGKLTHEDLILVNYKNSLKLVDFKNNIIENYDMTKHGERDFSAALTWGGNDEQY